MANISGLGVSITAMVSTQHTRVSCAPRWMWSYLSLVLSKAVCRKPSRLQALMKAGDADKSQLIPELPPGWKIPLCAITRTGPK